MAHVGKWKAGCRVRWRDPDGRAFEKYLKTGSGRAFCKDHF